MTGASGAIGLEVVLRPGHPHVEQTARLAARLGYRAVWLEQPPSPDEVRRLLATRTRIGLLDGCSWPPAGDPERLLVETPDPAIGPAPVGRMHTADGALVGYVVHSRDRDHAADALRALRGRPLPAGLSIAVDLPVVFGRTLGEARARLDRDPLLRDTRDPIRAGLYGTFADAQAQLVDLIMAGADTVRADFADEADVADLLAQLRAVSVGPVALMTSNRHRPTHQEVSR